MLLPLPGHYIVVVAYMSMAASLETPVLLDYLQSGTTIQDSGTCIEGKKEKRNDTFHCFEFYLFFLVTSQCCGEF